MKNAYALNFFLTAALLSITVLTGDIPLVRAVEWSSETRLTTDSKQDMNPSIMQARDGTIWVVWVSNRLGFGNDELYYKTSSNYGTDWSPDTRLTADPNYDSSPSIMQSSNGTIWVTWASYRTENYELFYKTFNGSWSSDIQLTTEPNQDIDPSIMQARNGLIWVVWHSNRTGNFELFYKTYGSVWSTDTQLTDDSSIDKYPSIGQDCDETIWVVWSSNRTENFELLYKTFNGTAWSSDNQLTNDLASDLVPSIAQARDGTIWVVWQSDRPSEAQDELYYKIYNGSVWSSDAQLTDDHLSNDIAPSIVQVDNRKIWVVWSADKDKDFDIYYKTSSEIINHDVAVIEVAPSATRANKGEILSVIVVVENQGDGSEIFNVNLYANTTTINSTTIALGSRTSTTITFLWNTTSSLKSIYSISAEASVVPNEIHIRDNVCRDGMVTVTVPGDVNGDTKVDFLDLALMANAYGKIEGSIEYNPYADLNRDGIIDIFDLSELGKNYAQN